MNVRLLITMLLWSCWIGGARAEDAPPLYDHAEMQALKLRLAEHLWEVEVLPKPADATVDPESVPRRSGQGVLIDVPQRGPRIIVSGDLARGWSRVTALASGGRRCTAQGIRQLEDVDIALIRCAEPLSSTPVVPLAPDELGAEGSLVFSVDDPTGTMPSLYHGFLAGPAEPPLADFQYVHLGGFWSYPLLNHRGELVALTLRRLRPQPDTLSLAVTCRQLRARLLVRRRNPEGPTRLRETTRRPFHYE